MPTATNRGTELHYERAGSGEVVAFVPTLGYGPWQWSWQFPAVAGPSFEAIATVLRGTPPSGGAPAEGASEGDSAGSATASASSDGAAAGSNGASASSDGQSVGYDVSTLAEDLETVLADAGASRAHLVGFGLGGHVALEHAARHDRARSLVLIATTPGVGDGAPPSAPAPSLPEAVVDRLSAPRDDPKALRKSLAPALSEAFRDGHADVVEGVVEWRSDEDADRAAWDAQAAAFEDWERDWPTYEVTEPTLVVQGGADEVVPPANADALAARLPNAEVERYDGAGHLVTVERSRPLNDRLVGWLTELERR